MFCLKVRKYKVKTEVIKPQVYSESPLQYTVTQSCFGASRWAFSGGNLHQLLLMRVAYLFLGPTWELALPTATARKNWREDEADAERTRKVKIRSEEGQGRTVGAACTIIS